MIINPKHQWFQKWVIVGTAFFAFFVRTSKGSLFCSSCLERNNDTLKCISWHAVDCASIYGVKPVTCVFYPAANSTRLSLGDQDKYCIPEEKLKPLYSYNVTTGNGSCVQDTSGAFVCICAGDTCNSNAGVQHWLDPLTTTPTTTAPTTTTTKKKCKCCCDEQETSGGEQNLRVSFNFLSAFSMLLSFCMINFMVSGF